MKAITQYIYDLIFLVFISRKLQLSSVVILFLSPVANELQSPGVSPCIVAHLQALFVQNVILHLLCTIPRSPVGS